jgi:hypothetical protein
MRQFFNTWKSSPNTETYMLNSKNCFIIMLCEYLSTYGLGFQNILIYILVLGIFTAKKKGTIGKFGYESMFCKRALDRMRVSNACREAPFTAMP